jgi:hypothetical protein
MHYVFWCDVLGYIWITVVACHFGLFWSMNAHPLLAVLSMCPTTFVCFKLADRLNFHLCFWYEWQWNTQRPWRSLRCGRQVPRLERDPLISLDIAHAG